MPHYDYECPVDGVFEVFQSIKEPAYTHCPCGRRIKRLVSGGCGIIMDADRCYDTLPPQGDGKVREAKTDLRKSEAYLIGVPPAEREYYQKLHRGR